MAPIKSNPVGRRHLRTPPSSPRSPRRNWPTPKRAEVRALRRRFPWSTLNNHTIFRIAGVPERTGYRILAAESSRKSRKRKEHAGAPTKLSDDQVQDIIEWFTGDYKARISTWREIKEEFNLDCSWQTIRRRLNAHGYHKCKACQRGYISPENVEKRLVFAMKRRRWGPIWRHIRFSDEVHFSFGSRNAEWVI